MDKKTFAQWRRNGNLAMSENEILVISNDIAEGRVSRYTKKELAEVVTYWSLEAVWLGNQISDMKAAKLSDEIQLALQTARESLAAQDCKNS